MNRLLIAFSLCIAVTSPWGIADQAADEIYHSVRDKTGSRAALQQNVVNPLSGGSQLSTFDGSTSFNASIAACGRSDVFMKLTTQPLSNGKLKLLTIEQDTTMDGEIDTAITPNLELDLICANGFSLCDNVDDFSTCESYAWSANGTKVAIQGTALSSLGGCYCISGRCGASLAWRNLDTILRDLGMGAGSALAQENDFFRVGGVDVRNTQALIAGSTGECATGDVSNIINSPDKETLTQYNSNPKSLEGAAATATGNSSVYKMIQSGSLNPNETSELRSCAKRRTPQLYALTLNDILALDGGSGGISSCGDDCIQLVLGTVGNDYWGGSCTDYYFSTRFYVKRPDLVKSATIIRLKFDDWMQIKVNNEYFLSGPYNNWTGDALPGACELRTSWDYNPNASFKHLLPSQPGPVNFDVRVNVTGNGEGYLYGQVRADLACEDLNNDLLSNTCTAYETDQDCVLESETVDGVKVYQSGAITGLTPLPQTQSVSNNSCTLNITRPWFEKKRVYRCETKTDFDLSKATERSTYIKENTTHDEYKDMTFNSKGDKSYASGTLDFGAIPTVSACSKVCKVRKELPPQAAITGTQDRDNTSGSMYEISYKQCYLPLNSTEETCDLDNGETLVTPCQCADDFGEATAMMQIMRMAGQDMICSTGIPQQPQ